MKIEITKHERSLIDRHGVVADTICEGLRQIEESIIDLLDIDSDDVERLSVVRGYVRGHIRAGAKVSIEHFLERLGIVVAES